MTLQPDIDATLKQFARFGIHLGLERIQQLLEDLGDPHQQMPVIHVAGTNGKGSVCAYLSAVLAEAGYRVGRFTSPHLVDWAERICINEQPIAPVALLQCLQQIEAAIAARTRKDARAESPTQFEVITAAAWLYFSQQTVDIAVVEVGLGGRLDATNVCDRALVSIITSISRDHWQRLGPTLANIAGEKAGILKANCPAIIGPLPEEVIAVFKARIQQLHCPVQWPVPAKSLGDGWAVYPNPDLEGSDRGATPPLKYRLPLSGTVQLTNSALAIAALHQLREQGWDISDDAIAQGMAKARWPGRLQRATWQGQPLLLDGAHNQAAAIALRQSLDIGSHPFANEPAFQSFAQQPLRWVIGMLATKDSKDILQALLRSGDRVYFLPVPDHQSAAPESLAAIASTVCPQLANCQVLSTLDSALRAATQSPENTEPHLTVLCGSLYLVGYFLKQYGAETPSSI